MDGSPPALEPEPEPEPEPPATALQGNGGLFDDCFGSDSSDDDGDDGAAAEHGSGTSWVRPPVALQVWEEVVSSEVDGGQGLRATATIAMGDEIHKEAAALRCPNAHAARTEDEALRLHKQCVFSRFTALPLKQQAEVRVLMSWDKYNDADGSTTIWGVFQTNSVRLTGQDEGDGGLFRTFCRMNHSCLPNVSHTWRPELQKLVLTAKRDIAVGEELYTTYGGYEFTDSTAQRREHLLTEFGFHCMCQLCVQSDRAEAPEGDGLTKEGWRDPRDHDQ